MAVGRFLDFPYRTNGSDRIHVQPMKLLFIVAGTGRLPNGGLRIIYEHADRLAARGHDVAVYHGLRFPGDGLRSWPSQVLEWMRHRLSARKASWFSFKSAPARNYRFFARLPKTDPDTKLIATYWKTHELLDKSTLANRRCFYLIQGIESWYVREERLEEHWKSASINLTISRWLMEHVRQVSGQALLIPNAIDFAFFNEGRNDRSRFGAVPTVLFAAMKAKTKGSALVVEALNALKGLSIPFRLLSFGDMHPWELGLQCDVRHYDRPAQSDLRDLYRRSDLFLNASYSEGWGLTLAEATACGAALLVSDAEGHFEFARPGKSAFFFKRGDVEGLTRKAAFLLTRPRLRKRLVENAKTDLAPFTWTNAVDRMEAALSGRLTGL